MCELFILCFYIKYGSFGYSFCDKNCILRSVEERVNFELKWYQSFISQKKVFILGLAISARNMQSTKILFLCSEK